MFDKMLACDFLAPDVGIEVVRHAAEVIPAIKEYWERETRDSVGIAPAMSAMTEEAIGGSDELRTDVAPGVPVWTGLGLE
jgi:hypothetical protein